MQLIWVVGIPGGLSFENWVGKSVVYISTFNFQVRINATVFFFHFFSNKNFRLLFCTYDVKNCWICYSVLLLQVRNLAAGLQMHLTTENKLWIHQVMQVISRIDSVHRWVARRIEWEISSLVETHSQSITVCRQHQKIAQFSSRSIYNGTDSYSVRKV